MRFTTTAAVLTAALIGTLVAVPTAANAAPAAYAVAPRIPFDLRYQPRLDSGRPDSVTPGLSYAAVCWTHGQTVRSSGPPGSSDIWLKLYGNRGSLAFGPVVHFVAWPGSVTAGVGKKC